LAFFWIDQIFFDLIKPISTQPGSAGFFFGQAEGCRGFNSQDIPCMPYHRGTTRPKPELLWCNVEFLRLTQVGIDQV
jgi:hypothetical protein